MCDLDSVVAPNHSAAPGCDLDEEVEAANRAAWRNFSLDPAMAALVSSSTPSGRVAAANRGAVAWYNLDAEAEAMNQTARRDFFLDPTTATCAPFSTLGGRRLWRARLPQHRSGDDNTSPPSTMERLSASDKWDCPFFSHLVPITHLVSAACLAPVPDCALVYGVSTKRSEKVLVPIKKTHAGGALKNTQSLFFLPLSIIYKSQTH